MGNGNIYNKSLLPVVEVAKVDLTICDSFSLYSGKVSTSSDELHTAC